MGKDGKGGNPREGDRKATILRAAVEVFATKGYHGCRIADVAREAGVAYGLVYHYFKNKDELLQSVFRLGFDSFIAKLTAVTRSEAPLAEKIHAIADFALESYREDPRGMRVLILQIARSPAIGGANRQHAFSEIVQHCVEMFTRAQKAGELRPDVDPLLAAATFFGHLEMGLTTFVVGFYDAEDPVRLAAAKQQLAETFLRGAVLPGPDEESAWKKDRSSSTKLKTARRS